jgi:hypothetical protein
MDNNPDREIATRCVYQAEYDRYEGDAGDGVELKLQALHAAVRRLGDRVAQLEQAQSDKPPRRQARRPAAGGAPTGGETMLHRRGKIWIRSL